MYRTICTELWNDPKVRQLSADSTYLFLYLITNPHTHLCGLYYLMLSTMTRETQLSRRRFDGAWLGLRQQGMVEYDVRCQQVWVKKMFGFQGRGQKTDRGVAYHLQGLHASPLIERFLLVYPQVILYLPPDFERYPMDGASKGDAVFPSPISSSSLNSLSSDPDKKHEERKVNSKRVWSDDLSPTQKHHELAKTLGIDLGPEWGKFKNYCKAHAKRYADFEAAFRNWLVGAAERKGGKYGVR